MNYKSSWSYINIWFVLNQFSSINLTEFIHYFFNGTIEDDKIKNLSLNSVDYVDYFLLIYFWNYYWIASFSLEWIIIQIEVILLFVSNRFSSVRVRGNPIWGGTPSVVNGVEFFHFLINRPMLMYHRTNWYNSFNLKTPEAVWFLALFFLCCCCWVYGLTYSWNRSALINNSWNVVVCCARGGGVKRWCKPTRTARDYWLLRAVTGTRVSKWVCWPK